MLKLKPVLSPKIWGGEKLAKFTPLHGSKNIGEALICSGLKHESCVVIDGPYDGKTLAFLYANNNDLFRYKKTVFFPLLIKLIDAKQDLSVQVHPNDSQAKELENQPNGKSECWFVLDTAPRGDIITGTLAADESEFTALFKDKKWNQLLRVEAVRSGDFMNIPAGTVHAIRTGTLLYELQQPSDVTYRLYDYDRIDINTGLPRELHIDKGIKVIDYGNPGGLEKYEMIAHDNYEVGHLINNAFFGLDHLETHGTCLLDYYDRPFVVFSVLNGEGMLNNVRVHTGDTVILLEDDLANCEFIGKCSVNIAWPN